MEDRRPRAGKPDDEHRRDDLLVRDGRKRLPVVHVAEPVHRVTEHPLAGDEPAHVVQASLVLEGVDEQRQRFEVRAVTEVVEAVGPPGRLGDDRLDLERLRLRAFGAHVKFLPPRCLQPTDGSVFVMTGISEPLYHLALAGEWAAAVDAGDAYRSSTVGHTLDDVGFIHCSFAHQVQQTADAYYRGRTDVVVLTIDASSVDATIRVDPAESGEGFPHVYGPLNLDAVIHVEPLATRDDGTFDVAIGP